MNRIIENLNEIRTKITAASERAGRTEEPTLIVVTKTIDVERIKTVVSCGINELGENRVQELVGKLDHFSPGMNWHLIGRLQTNKVKYIVGKVTLIHSVDSEKLAEAISKCALKLGIVQDVLLEINIGNEETKTGITPDEAVSFSEKLAVYEGIRLKGLMCIAPFVEKPEENRALFRKMKQLFVDIRDNCIDNKHIDHLSMGMSNDYEIAIEEGATLVRIGSGIFGERAV